MISMILSVFPFVGAYLRTFGCWKGYFGIWDGVFGIEFVCLKLEWCIWYLQSKHFTKSQVFLDIFHTKQSLMCSMFEIKKKCAMQHGGHCGQVRWQIWAVVLTKPPLKLLAEHFKISVRKAYIIYMHLPPARISTCSPILAFHFQILVKQEKANWNETHVVEMEYNCAAIQ